MKSNEKEPITRFDKALLELKETTKALIFSLLIIIKWIINLVYVIGFPLFELIIGIYYILKYFIHGKNVINVMSMETKEKVIEYSNKSQLDQKPLNWGVKLTNKWLIELIKKDLEEN